MTHSYIPERVWSLLIPHNDSQGGGSGVVDSVSEDPPLRFRAFVVSDGPSNKRWYVEDSCKIGDECFGGVLEMSKRKAGDKPKKISIHVGMPYNGQYLLLSSPERQPSHPLQKISGHPIDEFLLHYRR